jgi:hypothetical protein
LRCFRVSALATGVARPSARVVRGLGVGVLCCVVSVFGWFPS